jgi:hypothetical protein
MDLARRELRPDRVIDLHCHSLASDGILPPADVMRAAAAAGLSAVALTDHDTTAGLAEARRAGAQLGVDVIGGCEFSVAVPWGELHLLGYFIEPGDVEIETFLAGARTQRALRGRDMVDRLNGLGIAVSHEDLAREVDGAAVGRPHVARALLRGGHVHTAQQAFDRYLGRGKPAFVDKVLPPCADVAALVHRRGGVVSAAHLKLAGTRDHVTWLLQQGVDAIETRHPSHTADVRAKLTDLVLALGLARSGGSDWHGETDPGGAHATMGSQQVPDEWLTELRSRRPATAT